MTTRSVAVLSVLALAGVANAEAIIGLRSDNVLVSFDSSTPGTIGGTVAVSGLQAGENLLGIDLRPATGQVIGLGSSNRLYSINTITGAATALGPAFSPVLDTGVEYGIDINPTVDRLRVVASNGGNRRFNPVNGAAVVPLDTNLSYASGGVPRAVAVAYTNSLAGVPAGSTREYGIDSANGSLIEIGTMAGGNPSFNGGVSAIVGALGFTTSDLVGLDIFGPTGNAFVSLTNPTSGFSSFYSLNLSTGAATLLGGVGDGSVTLRDFTAVPTPGAAGVLALGGFAALRRRRA
ncbi:MAG: DUF4394 domain-containing protein [Phycisphaerales bacterium]